MGWLNRFFGKGTAQETPDAEAPEHAVIIELDGVSLPDQVYETCDTDTLEGLLEEALGDMGECDGTETGPQTTKVYLYGSDAEAMFAKIEPVLGDYPLAAKAVVTLRQGPPGAPSREVRIPG